jgi:hypothetical protein
MNKLAYRTAEVTPVKRAGQRMGIITGLQSYRRMVYMIWKSYVTKETREICTWQAGH